MTKIYNRQEFKDLRTKLRSQSYDVVCERLLWQKIRGKQLGYKFRRQFGVSQYIVDFYCPQLRLAIELDGPTHATEQEIQADKQRQVYIENLKIAVKRYNNIDIKNNLSAVLSDLAETCDHLKR